MSNAAPTRTTSTLTPTLTPTVAIIIAAGIAAGIGLARPSTSTDGANAEQATAESATTVAPAPRRGGYLSAGDGEGAAAPAPVQPATAADPAAITISDFAFGGSAAAAPGAQVAVANADGPAHTLTAEGGEFDTGTISSGDSTSFAAPTAAGTYSYFCAIHPSMQGSITVS